MFHVHYVNIKNNAKEERTSAHQREYQRSRFNKYLARLFLIMRETSTFSSIKTLKMAKKQYKFRLIHEPCWYHWHFLFIVISAFGIIISLLSGLLMIVLPNPDITNLYIIRNIFFGSLGLAVLWAVLSLIGKIKIRLEEV